MSTPPDPVTGPSPASDAAARPHVGGDTPSSPAIPAAPLRSDAPAPPAADPAKQALGWMHTARFLTTAAQLHHLPSYDLPEIAFVGAPTPASPPASTS